jgi:glycosyltransferase involved in cell wall biosynthesis
LKITVFTPTYNRAYILETLYRSIKRQSYSDFEWLIIDDGSTDRTEELVEKWKQEEKDFSIRYYKKDNGGKCSAINMALDLAKGEVFFVADSDDYLTDNALEKIAGWMSGLPKGDNYCGVAGNLGISETETSNTHLKEPYRDGTMLDRYDWADGERAFAFYTDVHRKYKYPLFENEKFMTEAVTYNRMAHDGYKVRFYNDIVCVYEYRNDGLTWAGSKLFLQNPHGYGLWLKERALYTGSSKLDMLRLYYTFTCDLSTYYDTAAIAGYIGTSTAVIVLCQVVHKLRRLIKRK